MRLLDLLRGSLFGALLSPGAVLPAFAITGRASLSLRLLASGLLLPLTRAATTATAPASAARTFADLPAFVSRFGGFGLFVPTFCDAFLALVALLLVLMLMRGCLGMRVGVGWPLAFPATFRTPASAPPAP